MASADAGKAAAAREGTTNSERDATNSAKEVLGLFERWVAAVGHRDLAGILRDHAPEVLMFDLPPPLLSRGIDAYERTWEAFFAWSHDPVMFDVLEVDATAGTDVAFVTAVVRCAGTDSDTAVELEFRLTMGLRKIEGRWTVVHEHHSIPASA